MTTQQRGNRYLLLAVIWTMISLLALFAPKDTVGVETTLSIPGLDKIGHFILFAIWAYLIAKAISERKMSINPLIFCGAFALFAILTEVIQNQIGRSFEWLDVLADIIGIIIGLLIYRRV